MKKIAILSSIVAGVICCSDSFGLTGEWKDQGEVEIKNLKDMTNWITANRIQTEIDEFRKDRQNGELDTVPINYMKSEFQRVANTFHIENLFKLFENVITKIALSNMDNATKAEVIRELIHHITDLHLRPTLEKTPNPPYSPHYSPDE